MGDPTFSYFALLARATRAVLRKENRMKSVNATSLHRKSGGKPSKVFRPELDYRFPGSVSLPDNENR